VLAAVEVPLPSARARSVSYKVSKRRELDISTVSAGLFLETDEANVVTCARLAFGGLAATPKRATAAEQVLLGQPWSAQAVERAATQLPTDFTPLSDHRGSAAYRLLVAQNLLRGFFDETRDTPQPALRRGHAATVQPAGAP
jgi:xanthine dehydrogenase small subunit